MRKTNLLLLLTLLILTACSPPEAVLPTEETPIYLIQYSPSLETFRPEFQTCANENSSAFFQLQADQAFTDNTADLNIRLGEPQSLPGFMAQIGKEEIVVIIHPNNQSILTQIDLQNIFSGRLTNWAKIDGQGDIKVWTLPMENETSQLFQEYFLSGMLFSSNAQIAPGPAQILEAVSADPASIGYLPQSWVNASVTALDLNIIVPILVFADAEPEGALREFVACLQGN